MSLQSSRGTVVNLFTLLLLVVEQRKQVQGELSVAQCAGNPWSLLPKLRRSPAAQVMVKTSAGLIHWLQAVTA